MALEQEIENVRCTDVKLAMRRPSGQKSTRTRRSLVCEIYIRNSFLDSLAGCKFGVLDCVSLFLDWFSFSNLCFMHFRRTRETSRRNGLDDR